MTHSNLQCELSLSSTSKTSQPKLARKAAKIAAEIEGNSSAIELENGDDEAFSAVVNVNVKS